MPDETDTDARISRAVPLDQLRQPETDVREHRPESAVKSLAASMGDPSTGQLQDILVHPVDHEAVVEDGTENELHSLFQDGHDLRVVDGETRRMAAERLGWATINATIVPEPPEDTVVAQLDANTERIEMTEYETVRALYEHYEETDSTLAEVGEKVGYSKGHLSRVFGLMDSPGWLHDAWRHPDHPLETSHALAVYSMLSADSVERYARAGNIDEQAAYERAVEDAKLMIDVQTEHDLQVGEFRKRCKRCTKETLDQLKDERSLEEKRAGGQTREAERSASASLKNEPDPEPCMVCGDEADRKIALDVCKQDYGMLSEMKANDGVLMANAGAQPTAAGQLDDDADTDKKAAQALAAVSPIDEEQALGVIREVRQQASEEASAGDD